MHIRMSIPAITFGGETQSLYEQVQSGALDAVEGDAITPPQVLSSYSSNPSLNDFWYSRQLLGVRHVYINVTTPPFDDVHVRKAMNWVVNKASLARLYGGPAFGQIATHVLSAPAADPAVPASYDPEQSTPGSQGSVTKAKAEMMLSKYAHEPRRTL